MEVAAGVLRSFIGWGGGGGERRRSADEVGFNSTGLF
jgi:hypothetical protein